MINIKEIIVHKTYDEFITYEYFLYFSPSLLTKFQHTQWAYSEMSPGTWLVGLTNKWSRASGCEMTA